MNTAEMCDLEFRKKLDCCDLIVQVLCCLYLNHQLKAVTVSKSSLSFFCLLHLLTVVTKDSSEDEIPERDVFLFSDFPNMSFLARHKKIQAEVYKNLIMVKSDLQLNLN